jgi:hypothetical protein
VPLNENWNSLHSTKSMIFEQALVREWTNYLQLSSDCDLKKQASWRYILILMHYTVSCERRGRAVIPIMPTPIPMKDSSARTTSTSGVVWTVLRPRPQPRGTSTHTCKKRLVLVSQQKEGTVSSTSLLLEITMSFMRKGLFATSWVLLIHLIFTMTTMVHNWWSKKVKGNWNN